MFSSRKLASSPITILLPWDTFSFPCGMISSPQNSYHIPWKYLDVSYSFELFYQPFSLVWLRQAPCFIQILSHTQREEFCTFKVSIILGKTNFCISDEKGTSKCPDLVKMCKYPYREKYTQRVSVPSVLSQSLKINPFNTYLLKSR